MSGVRACPRCGAAIADGQEYCLECGMRMPAAARLGAPPLEPRRLLLPLLVTGVLATTGAAGAILITRDPAPAGAVLVATGGTVTQAPKGARPPTLAAWPGRKDGWTNVLVSVPKQAGRDAAVARAENARRRGLDEVGVLDSSRFSSLHPGYWTVFAGVYASEAEAASALQAARNVQRRARTQRIAR